ncbi:MAG: SLC13 family permease [Alphaproteobacteria bacterium]
MTFATAKRYIPGTVPAFGAGCRTANRSLSGPDAGADAAEEAAIGLDADPLWQMWAVFAVLAGAIAAYARERWSMEMVSIAILVLLVVFFYVFPVPGPEGKNLLDAAELLSGFANPALVSIMSLLVVGQGLFHAGALERPTRMLFVLGRRRPRRVLVMALLMAMSISAFLNDTPVTVMFIPIVATVAMRSGISPSRVMMPLSFLCVLGGTTTLIGTSTNLLVAEGSERLGAGVIGFFDFTVPALFLVAVGAFYVLTVMPRLLPRHEPMSDTITESGRQFIAQITLTAGHSLVGTQISRNRIPGLPNILVRLIQRDELALLPPFEGIKLRPGDVIIVAATRQALTEALTSKADLLEGMISHGMPGGAAENGTVRPRAGDLTLAEAVVAPGSRLIGSTIERSGFHHLTGTIVFGIQRRSRMIRARMRDIRLEAGDVLLLLGTSRQIQALRQSRDVLLLEWSSREVPNLRNARRARLIFAGMVIAAATGLVPIVIAALTGAGLMIATDCLTLRQAARAFDRRIFLLVGAALALGDALEFTGGAAWLAGGIVDLSSGSGPAAVLSALFLLTAILTNLLTNNATAVLFTPVAVDAARALGADPTPFLHAVIFAANCPFATPMGYQTNLLVMGPGRYQFVDYTRAGLPLVVLLWLSFSLFAPWYYGL